MPPAADPHPHPSGEQSAPQASVGERIATYFSARYQRRLAAALAGTELPVPASPMLRLGNGQLHLRAFRYQDGARWSQLRLDNQPWLEPVEPTTATTWVADNSRSAWDNLYQRYDAGIHSGNTYPFAIDYDGELVGQITIGGVQRGICEEAWVGYWVDHRHTGKGIATAACALAVDFGFAALHLHRLSATCLPTNLASARVLTGVGFREEGLGRGYLHIDGDWRDLRLFALLEDDYPVSAVRRLARAGRLGYA